LGDERIMTDYYCPTCGEHPQFIIQNPATGKPHCHSCGTVLVDARKNTKDNTDLTKNESAIS